MLRSANIKDISEGKESLKMAGKEAKWWEKCWCTCIIREIKESTFQTVPQNNQFR